MIGVWQRTALDIVNTEFMQPLRKELAKSQVPYPFFSILCLLISLNHFSIANTDEYLHTLSSEEQQKKIELMTKHGFPRLSPAQMEQASNATLSSLYMVKEIFDRIEELLKEETRKDKPSIEPAQQEDQPHPQTVDRH